MLEELGLVNGWRAKTPTTIDLTFLSTVHGSYSRIYLICISKQSLHKIKECLIEPIMLSDHDPVNLKLNLGFERHFKFWRLNIYLFKYIMRRGIEQVGYLPFS